MSSLPILNWRAHWRQPGVVRADLLAGLTGAVVVLPQGVAFATLAGLPAQYGLYAAMLPCIVAAMFGSSRLMVTGPANAISLMTMALIAPLAAAGSPDYIRLVITLSFLVGLMQVLLGLAKIGSFIERMPHSVVVGFTTGAAVLIFNSQLGTGLGLSLTRSTSVFSNLQAVWQQLAQFQWPALISALATIAIAVLAKPWNRIVPAMLLAVVGGSLLALLIEYWMPAWPLTVKMQALPSALPPLSLPDLQIDTIRSLFGPTLVMTLLALTEAAAIAKSVARRFGDTLDGNQEFVGQGLANLAGSFFSSYPTSGSFNRSGVNVEAGAQTPLAAICAALLLGLLLLVVAPLARFLPMPVIAGLLFVVAWGLIDFAEIKRIFKQEPGERTPLLVTLIATVTLSLEWAILLGITSALLVQRLGRRNASR